MSNLVNVNQSEKKLNELIEETKEYIETLNEEKELFKDIFVGKFYEKLGKAWSWNIDYIDDETERILDSKLATDTMLKYLRNIKKMKMMHRKIAKEKIRRERRKKQREAILEKKEVTVAKMPEVTFKLNNAIEGKKMDISG